jgi:hypothetical protein
VGLPWAAVATLLGATITGLFALLQLIISKETKVSEFRQAWIDGLRSDVAEYIGALRLFVSIHLLHPRIRRQRIGDLFQQTVDAQTRVQLRLRPEQNVLHARLARKIAQIRASARELNQPRNKFMDAYEKALSGYAAMERAEKTKDEHQIEQATADYKRLMEDSDALSNELNALVKATGAKITAFGKLARPVLDDEWEKVKEGEKRYVLVRNSVIAACLVAAFLFLVFFGLAIWPYLQSTNR